MNYKNIKLIKVSLFIAVFFILSACHDISYARPNKPKDNLEFGTWRNKLKGSLGFANTGFDLKSDFKADGDFDYKTVALLGYSYKLGYYSDIYLRSNLTKNSGSLKAAGKNNVLINNIVFGAGGVSNIAVDMRLSDIELLASRELAATDRNGFIDVIYGAKFIRLSLDLTDKDFKMSNHYLRQLLVPVAGFHTQCKIDDNFKFYAWLYAGSAKADSGSSMKQYKTTDLDAGIEYHLTPRAPEYVEIGPGRDEEPESLTQKIDWYVIAGYKARSFKETMGANVIKIDHSGPEIKFSARF
ncbi:MAG TPA: hypothetical protein PKW98_01950 [Candidatus Wallbacteria bacterium]|nr:MAG: hypothetical protein BWY32_02668 [bacterium ADurb.Bin243]HPG56556.1 hypothetical protein [Candidatus Wallbacteria bacterium]